MNPFRNLLTTALVTLSFFAIGPEAQAQRRGTGEVELTAENGQQLSLEIDGRRFDRFGTHLVLQNIPTGRKRIVIYRLKPHDYDRGATAQTVYEGRILIQAGMRCAMVMNPTNGDLRITQEPVEGVVASSTPAPTAPVPEQPTAALGMATLAKGDWVESLQGKTTDTEKLKALKAYVTGHSITTQTLVQMLGELLFEDSRLALATAALPNITDRQNLSTITATFETDQSRKTFEAAVKKIR